MTGPRPTKELSKAERDALESLAWGMKHFGGIVTNRVCPRRVVLKLVAKGLAVSLGQVVICDDDGCIIHPERYGEGFALTEAGQQAHAELMQWYRQLRDPAVAWDEFIADKQPDTRPASEEQQ